MTEHPAAHSLEGHAAGDVDTEVERHLEDCALCRRYVDVLVRAAARYAAAAAPPPWSVRRPFARVAFVVLPLLGAAVAAMAVLHWPATVVPAVPANAPRAPIESTRFKGTMELAVVRERGREQERFTTDVPVHARDRLRVEVAVDSAQPVTVGILGVDGSWLVVLAPALLDGGMHLSEGAALVDDAPGNGWVLAGAPDAVLRARTTRVFAGVAVLPIVFEP